MLGLVVVAIMMGFPTAFTLMGMGMMFGWFAYRSVNPDLALNQILDLMVQRTYSVMSNDVLIAIPLFVFMGYLVERANLIEKLFRSLHLAMARVPGSLAVATIVTCAIFATATGIVGAVVTLMGLLAFPAMLKAGYNVQIGAGAVTAGGCLGILIPPSVLLIVYGATAGVSVVQLYAGAFFPGIMLAALYVGLRDRPGEDQAKSDAAVVRRRPARRVALFRAALVANWESRSNRSGTRSQGSAKCRCAGTHVGFSTGHHATARIRHCVVHGADIQIGHCAANGAGHDRPAGDGFCGGGRRGADQASTGLAEPPPAEGSLQEPPSEGDAAKSASTVPTKDEAAG